MTEIRKLKSENDSRSFRVTPCIFSLDAAGVNGIVNLDLTPNQIFCKFSKRIF